MPQNNAERLTLAKKVLRSLAIENKLSPIQARSFVRCLQTTWEVPTIAWNEKASQNQLADARRLIHTAEMFREIEGVSSARAIDCYRRAAELLEWLSRSEDPLRTTAPIELYAAAAYQLGGLPAMASGLLGQVELLDEGTRLLACFLRADFDGVLQAAANFWHQHPELTDRDASNKLLAEESEDKISWYIVVELIRSLGLIADSLRRGNDERLSKALQKLDGLDKLAVRMVSDDTSLLIMLLSAVGRSFKDASIYNSIFQLSDLSPRHTDRLKAFARGQFSRGRGILWSSQQHGLERLLSESSFALCTPTGSGKTLVANLALVKELLLTENDNLLAPLGLYLVPSRALAGEVEAKLKSELGHDFIITGLYGGSDWGITDYWLNVDRPTVLIATVEKADALMRYLGPILLARLRLLIVDEAHQVVSEETEHAKSSFADHSNRALRLEGFVSRLIAQSPNIVRIALTAVAGGAAQPVARWIEGRLDAKAVSSRYRSTRQVIGVLEASPQKSGRMLLNLMNNRPLSVLSGQKEKPVYINLTTPAMPELPPKIRDSVNHFNELNVLWTALHLVEGERRILISVLQQPEKIMGWYAEAFSLPDWQESIAFEPPEDESLLALYQETREACIDYCGVNSYELLLLEHGIASNHGQMPQRLRRLMTNLIDRRICPITVATSTLTEGVNLPFDLIFLTSLKRTSIEKTSGSNAKVSRKIHRLTTSEFRNLAGRAGRPGAAKGMEGMMLVAIPQRPSTTAPSKLELQRKQVFEIKSDYKILHRQLLAEEEHEDYAKSPLSLLIETIADLASSELGIENDDELLDWLDSAIPSDISEEAGRGFNSSEAQLADSVDELDGFLLTALEELNGFEGGSMNRAEAETFLTNLWQRTFVNVTAAEETWLEQVVIRRGGALIEEIYPDAGERKRLYQYGFTPYIGRRFEAIAPAIKSKLESTVDYGEWSPEEKLSVFNQLSDLLAEERGFGFRVRDTVTEQGLLENRHVVLAWWMKIPEAEIPEPIKLRSWQKFVSDNLEFRLGVAIGAVVAQSWSEGADDPLEAPSLAVWKETTGLPWFGFWAKELLRWGTLDPFVAFAQAQGLAKTRDKAMARRPEFDTWLEEVAEEEVNAEDLIDPQRFLQWQQSLPRREITRTPEDFGEIELTGTTGQLGRYHVIPVLEEDGVNWIDASGFSLAKSIGQGTSINTKPFRRDYDLVVSNKNLEIEKVF